MNDYDFRGNAIVPTPSLPDANKFGVKRTMDLAETTRLVEALVRDGDSGLIATGTIGECATLSTAAHRGHRLPQAGPTLSPQ